MSGDDDPGDVCLFTKDVDLMTYICFDDVVGVNDLTVLGSAAGRRGGGDDLDPALPSIYGSVAALPCIVAGLASVKGAHK